MFVLQVTTVLLLVSGVHSWGGLWGVFNNCNPPQSLVGKFCTTLLDDDMNSDGVVNSDDFIESLIPYDRDADACNVQRWEFVSHWQCRYGWSSEFGHFMFDRFDSNPKDGLVTTSDFSGPVNMSSSGFLSLQYTVFKDQYCSVAANRANRIDKELCEQVDQLNAEDVKCEYA